MRTGIVSATAVLACLWSSARETFSGVVLRQNGKPASGATICVATVFHHPPLRTNLMADEHGMFRIELIKVRQYRLAVRWQTEGVDLTEGVDSDGKSVPFGSKTAAASRAAPSGWDAGEQVVAGRG